MIIWLSKVVAGYWKDLERCLDGDQPGLDWPTRLRIIQGVTKGLDFLNQQFPGISLPHGHQSLSHVLLDDAFNPLLADYALAPILKNHTVKKHMKAYKSPEFTQHNQRVMKKTDVWCLGILILEMLTGICDMGELYRERRVDSKVFDNCMKWAKNNDIEMIDLMDIGSRCCESMSRG
nr:probable LRR receptor-like serine/threonine-protein kinase At4g31250 [Tanacetum cinerariifolium]